MAQQRINERVGPYRYLTKIAAGSDDQVVGEVTYEDRAGVELAQSSAVQSEIRFPSEVYVGIPFEVSWGVPFAFAGTDYIQGGFDFDPEYFEVVGFEDPNVGYLTWDPGFTAPCDSVFGYIGEIFGFSGLLLDIWTDQAPSGDCDADALVGGTFYVRFRLRPIKHTGSSFQAFYAPVDTTKTTRISSGWSTPFNPEFTCLPSDKDIKINQAPPPAKPQDKPILP